MANEMVERVARALCAADERESDCADMWSEAVYLPKARAAIEAMQEPTRDMIRAGHKAMQDEFDSDFGTGYRAALSILLTKEAP